MTDRRASDELLGRRLIKLFKAKEAPPALLGSAGVVPKPPFSNPMTAEDDLIVGGESGAPARLGKGADGQVLGVDPVTHRLAWIDQTGGGGPATGRYRALTLALIGGELVVLDDGTGHPVTTLEDLE